MFLQAFASETRAVESAIGDASAFGRRLIENAGGDTSSGVNVSVESALTLPYVYACINVLSQTLAHVPLNLLKDGNKGPEKARRHRLYDLMANPHHDFSGYTWRETLEGHRNGWGNAMSWINEDKLEILYPDRTSIHRLGSDNSLVYVTEVNGKKKTLLAADVLHFAGMGYDGIQGYSPINKAREAIGLGLAIHKFGGSFFGNGMSPKAVIESEMPANTLTQFAAEFKKNYGSIENANGTPILPKGLTYKPVTINPDDAQTLETLKYSRTEICGMFRVPPQFVMDLERSTFTNAAEMDLHFVKHTMIPIFTNWEAELDRKLLTDKERRLGYHFKFNVNGLLRGSQKERFDSYHLGLQDGWLSRNEVRVMEDLPTVDTLDEFLIPNNMVQPNADESDPPEADQPTEEPTDVQEPTDVEEKTLPLVRSIAERMASKERRALERCGEDISAVGLMYKDHPEFISRAAMPTAEYLADILNCCPEDFVANFAQRHIELQLGQQVNRVGDMVVDEQRIIATFFEVLKENANY